MDGGLAGAAAGASFAAVVDRHSSGIAAAAAAADDDDDDVAEPAERGDADVAAVGLDRPIDREIGRVVCHRCCYFGATSRRTRRRGGRCAGCGITRR